MYHTPAVSKAFLRSIGVRVARKKSSGSANRKRRWRLFLANPRCYWCEIMVSFENSTLDHVLPKSRGGDNSRENLVLCCPTCNNLKGSSTWIKDCQGVVTVLD